MHSICIKIINRTPELIDKLPACWGLIEINDLGEEIFQERFVMPITWWSCEYYEQQWLDGLKRIRDNSVSCLVTSAQLLFNNPFVNRWILYRQDETIYVQNQILFGEEFKTAYRDKHFDLKTCYENINPRRTKSESGQSISEWQFKTADL